MLTFRPPYLQRFLPRFTTSVPVLTFIIFHVLVPFASAEGVCTRTPQVKRAIQERFPEVEFCASITTTQLGKIKYLNLSKTRLSKLKHDDFTGLSNLFEVNLENNELKTLPQGLFDGLSNLQVVHLASNRISTLPARSFANLPNLRRVELNKNLLQKVPREAFYKLPKLSQLDLRGNTITYLSPFIPYDHPSLVTLGIDARSLTNLPPEIFSLLWNLELDAPRTTHLVIPGAFHTLKSGSGDGAAYFRPRRTRLFAVRSQYPPTSFAAYGIIAFRSLPTSSSRDRYEAICEGYVATALSAMVRDTVPFSTQFVTIWPLRTTKLATDLNSDYGNLTTLCKQIVNDIDLEMSEEAIARARQATGKAFDGSGPYLLAWSPGSDYSKSRAKVLPVDLSDVVNAKQAVSLFHIWLDYIERDPYLWSNRFDWNYFRTQLALLIDKYGNSIVQAFRLLKS